MSTAFNPFASFGPFINPFASFVPGASSGQGDPFAAMREAFEKSSAHPDIARAQSHAKAWATLASKTAQAQAAACQRGWADAQGLVHAAATELSKAVAGGPARLAQMPDIKVMSERMADAFSQAAQAHAKHAEQSCALAREAIDLGAKQAHEELDALGSHLAPGNQATKSSAKSTAQRGSSKAAGDAAQSLVDWAHPVLAGARSGVDAVQATSLCAVDRLQGLARQVADAAAR